MILTAQAPLPDVPTEAPEMRRWRCARCVAEAREDTHLSKKLYVRNLPFTTSAGELRTLFEPYCTVDRRR